MCYFTRVLPGGNPPGVAVCVCVACSKGKNTTIEHRAIAPANLSPAAPPLPVLACTLTYSCCRFGDTEIKAFLCFSLSFLSSFSSVTRALSAGALAHRQRELIQTETITFHFCCVISQSSLVSLQYVHHIVSSSMQRIWTAAQPPTSNALYAKE